MWNRCNAIGGGMPPRMCFYRRKKLIWLFKNIMQHLTWDWKINSSTYSRCKMLGKWNHLHEMLHASVSFLQTDSCDVSYFENLLVINVSCADYFGYPVAIKLPYNPLMGRVLAEISHGRFIALSKQYFTCKQNLTFTWVDQYMIT